MEPMIQNALDRLRKKESSERQKLIRLTIEHLDAMDVHDIIDPANLAKTLRDGLDAFISKPENKEDLLQRLTQQLESSQFDDRQNPLPKTAQN